MKDDKTADDAFEQLNADDMLSALESGALLLPKEDVAQTSAPQIESIASPKESMMPIDERLMELAPQSAPPREEKKKKPNAKRKELKRQAQQKEKLEQPAKAPRTPKKDSAFHQFRTNQKTKKREKNRRRRTAEHSAESLESFSYHPLFAFPIQRMIILRMVLAAALLIVSRVIGSGIVPTVLAFVGFAIAAFSLLERLLHQVSAGQPFQDCALLLLGSIGVFATGHFIEAGVILLLYTAGRLIADCLFRYAMRKTQADPVTLPIKATKIDFKGKRNIVSAGTLKRGDFVVVTDGEQIPVDAEVINGSGQISQTPFGTAAVAVSAGAVVCAGAVYSGDRLLLRANCDHEDCLGRRIARMQDKQRTVRSPLEESVFHTLPRYFPLALLVIILVALLPPLFKFGSFGIWLYRAVCLLILCCPTALVLSVPLSFQTAIRRLEQDHIYVGSSDIMEKLSELRMLIFEKGGTVTEGEPRIKQIILAATGLSEQHLLLLAASADQHTEHPIAKALLKANKMPLQRTDSVEEFPGMGVRAFLSGHNVLLGNRKLMLLQNVHGIPEIGGTVVYISFEGRYIGAIVLTDTVYPEASDVIASLRVGGLARVVLLSGDTEIPAQQIADAVGIDTVYSGLLPEEKAAKVEYLTRNVPTDGMVAFCGTGIRNQAALKTADIGIVFGTDAGKDTCSVTDVLLPARKLEKLTALVQVSRLSNRIAMQNMLLVLLAKLILVLLVLGGFISMWMLIIADILLIVLTALNALRILPKK